MPSSRRSSESAARNRLNASWSTRWIDMPRSCSRQAPAMTTSASLVFIAWSRSIADFTPCLCSIRYRRSAMLSTICRCTQEWSDIPSRSAVVCCASQRALSWVSPLAAARKAASLRLRALGARMSTGAIASLGVRGASLMPGTVRLPSVECARQALALDAHVTQDARGQGLERLGHEAVLAPAPRARDRAVDEEGGRRLRVARVEDQ